MRDFLPSVLIALVVIGTILFSELSPTESGAVIAVLGPNTSLREAVQKTDAYLVGMSEIPNGVILYSDQPGLPDRLKQIGVSVVLKASYAGGCISGREKPSQTRWTSVPLVN